LLFDWIDDDGWEWWEVDKDVRDHYRNKTDSILSLPALREALEKATGTCEWVHETEWYPHVYHTSCGKIESEEFVNQRPFCPFCGRRIEVKDVEKG